MANVVSVSSTLPGPGPVITTDPVLSTLDIPQFDDSLGTLVAIEFTFSGNITSTAVFVDFLLFGFGTVATGFVQSFTTFTTPAAAPDMPAQTLDLFAFNSIFVPPGGTESLLLNTTNTLEPISATDLDGASGDGTFALDLSMEGSFDSVPLGSLPQQAVTVGVDVDYFYLDPGEAVPAKVLTGTGQADRLTGIVQNETINGRGGKDKLSGDRGEDVIRGGAGKDTVFGGAGQDTIEGGLGRDKLLGQSGSDVVDGNAGADLLEGGSGNDSLSGGKGADQLIGDAGRDVLLGGRGADVLKSGTDPDGLNGGSGNDTLWGGADGDFFFFSPNGGRDIVRDFDPEEDEIHLPEFETDFSALAFDQRGDDVLLTIAGDTEVLLRGVMVEALVEDVFDFE